MNQWLWEQNPPGPVLDVPAAASTGYLDPQEVTHAPIVPPLNNVQALVEAAADMVASVEGLSTGPSEAEVSVFVESSAPVGMHSEM